MKTKIEQIAEMINKESSEIYTELREKARTYIDLEAAIILRLKRAKWDGNEVGELIFEKVMKKYEEEIANIKNAPIKGSEN